MRLTKDSIKAGIGFGLALIVVCIFGECYNAGREHRFRLYMVEGRSVRAGDVLYTVPHGEQVMVIERLGGYIRCRMRSGRIATMSPYELTWGDEP